MHKRKRSLVVLSVFSLLLVTVSPVAGSSPSNELSFNEREISEEYGDILRIPVDISDTATLKIRSVDDSTIRILNVVDGNEDGKVTILLNTYEFAEERNEKSVTTEAKADSVTVLSGPEPETGQFTAGKYSMVLSSESSQVSTTLELTEPYLHGASAYRAANSSATSLAPANSSNGQTVTAPGMNSVATGDVPIVHLQSGGIYGAIQQPPGKNLARAVDSTPNAETTHRIIHTFSENRTVSGLQVRYDTNAGPADITDLSIADIRTFGVDTDQDGIIESTLDSDIKQIKTSSSGVLTLVFRSDVQFRPSETILLEYAVRNPSVSGDNSVQLTSMAGENIDRGKIVYGPTGQGNLGNGISMDIEMSTGDQIDLPLEAVNITQPSSSDSPEFHFSNDLSKNTTYTLTIRATEEQWGDLEQQQISTSFSAVAPSAIPVVELTDNHSIAYLSGDTNLAPGNTLTVQFNATSESRSVSYIKTCSATVSEDGSFQCDLNSQVHLISEWDISNISYQITIRTGDSVIFESSSARGSHTRVLTP